MIARLRSLWQKLKKLSKPLIVVAIIILVVGVLVLVIFGYLLRGFFNRTLWDWLQLLIVPLVLAIIALVFQLANSCTEQQSPPLPSNNEKEAQKVPGVEDEPTGGS